MPTTLVGLLLFVALLAPGFTYLLIAERGPLPVRGVSVLRETASVALASVLFNAAAVITVAALRAVAPGLTPDTGRLVREGLPYLRTHYAAIAWWSAGALCLACLLAFVGATVLNVTHRLASFRRKPLFRRLFSSQRRGAHFCVVEVAAKRGAASPAPDHMSVGEWRQRRGLAPIA